jgi:hypothetical protein
MIKIKTTESKVYAGIKKLRESGADVWTQGMGGTVSVQGVEAGYFFDKETSILTITITEKPWLVSEEFIEGKIRSYFND